MNDLPFPKIRFLPLLLAAALTACSPGGDTAAQEAPPLQGAAIGGDFTLTDESGQTAQESDFAGDYRIVYFGYTFCPDVCPVDMQNLGRALRAFEADDAEAAGKLVPIFVSVDPGRDTPEVLAEYTANFHPRLIGMTGTREQLDAMVEAYGAWYEIEEDDGSGRYLVNHTNNATLFGPDGEPLAILPLQDSTETIVDTLRRWVR
ncbi:SCO family protein [Parasphingopyxis marina]|nr:SCO family protein [Parasphingopyxis marina]